MAVHLHLPNLEELCRRFVYDQINQDDDALSSEDITLEDCPVIRSRISRYNSARAVFHAPSEISGKTGMHSEMIRSNPRWRNENHRYDTVLVQNGPEDHPKMRGMVVGRVISFLAFSHEDVRYRTALVEWFLPVNDEPDPVTGMWIVRPEVIRGRRNVGIIHVECIVRACHLIGVYGRHYLPIDFHFSYSLDAFQYFYVNHYIDYHSHECIP